MRSIIRVHRSLSSPGLAANCWRGLADYGGSFLPVGNKISTFAPSQSLSRTIISHEKALWFNAVHKCGESLLQRRVLRLFPPRQTLLRQTEAKLILPVLYWSLILATHTSVSVHSGTNSGAISVWGVQAKPWQWQFFCSLTSCFQRPCWSQILPPVRKWNHLGKIPLMELLPAARKKRRQLIWETLQSCHILSEPIHGASLLMRPAMSSPIFFGGGSETSR